MNNSQPITEQTRQNLSKYCMLNMQVINEQLDNLRDQIRWLDKLSQERDNAHLPESCQITQMRRICEYTMLIGLISNDLSVVYRVYLRAEDPYEVQYATKQIVVILTEGFKQVYNFVSKNEKGDLVTKNRNNSIWKKDIGRIVKEQIPGLQKNFEDITVDLENFDDADLKAMQAPRNIFVHYDPKPCRAYDEMLAVHIEQVSQKAIPFLAILQRMMDFNFQMISSYVQVVIQATKDAFIEHKGILDKMLEENSHSPELVKIISKGIDNLANLKTDYDLKQILLPKAKE